MDIIEMIKRFVEKRNILYHKRDKTIDEEFAWDVYSRLYEIINEIAWFESKCEDNVAFHTINHTHRNIKTYMDMLPYISEQIVDLLNGKLDINSLIE